MKKGLLKLLLPILFITLCLGGVPMCALAAGGNEEQHITYEKTFSETVSGGGLAAYASPGPQFRTFSLSSGSGFPGSYGAQLTDQAGAIYNAMVQYFVTGGKTDDLQLGESVTFSCTGAGSWEPSAGYADAKKQLSYAVTSAYCALLYDHPELFWAYSMGYRWTVSVTTSGNTFTAKIHGITVSFTETYTGAKGDIGRFNSAVDQAVSDIGKNFTNSATQVEKLRAIHNYVCNNIIYPSGYSLNNIVPAYHSAAGMFLKNVTNGYGVCECYAKSFQILCRRFEMDCVLIVGVAGGAHMWDYVLVNGNWYLVDATWDDQSGGIKEKYFLAGSQSIGFDSKPIYQERTVYTRFTDSANAKSFTVPVLSSKAYPESSSGHEHNWELKDSKEATCKENGYWCYVCKEPGCGQESWIYRSEPHQFGEYVSDNNATCQKDGTKTRRCIVCGATGGTITDKGSKLPHRFVNYVSNNDATYTHDGTKTAYCEYGCGTKNTIVDEGSKLAAPVAPIAPSSAAPVTSAPAPASAPAAPAAAAASSAPVTAPAPAPAPASSELSASSIKSLVLQGNQSTSALKVGKTVAGDPIRRIESLNKKLVKVTSNGKIKALKKSGSAKLRITLASGATMTVKVKLQSGTVKTKKITGVPQTLTLSSGASAKLSPTLSPITSQQKLSYSTSDKKVVAVTSSGRLKAKKKGKAVISVKSGSKTVKCTVTVN